MTSRRLYLSGYAAVFLVACIAFFSLTFNREWTRPAEAPALEVPEQHLLFEQTSCVQLPQPSERPVAAVEDAPSPAPVKRRNVVVASAFPHHFDVYMTVVWTLERVLSYVPDYKVHVFAEPFNYGFQSLVDRLSLYHGRRRPTSELVPFMSGEEGETVDMIVLGTCEIECVTHISSMVPLLIVPCRPDAVFVHGTLSSSPHGIPVLRTTNSSSCV